MQRDISPEEKLLSIIKGNHNKALTEKNTGKAAVKDGKTEAAGLGNKIDNYISLILKDSFLKNNLFDPDIIKTFNRYMSIIAAVLTLYFIGDIFFANPSRKANSVVSNFSLSAMPLPLARKTTQVEARNYSYYSNKIAGKKIFGAGSYIQGGPREEAETAGEQRDGGIGLVGIIPGDKPQAIIEDKKSQKTYYLMKGQSVNDINVEYIDKDKVIIEYRGKRMSLFL